MQRSMETASRFVEGAEDRAEARELAAALAEADRRAAAIQVRANSQLRRSVFALQVGLFEQQPCFNQRAASWLPRWQRRTAWPLLAC